MRASWTLQVALAAALAAVCAATTAPQQIHIALAGNDGTGVSNAMAVSWVTGEETSTSTVKYGTSADNLDLVATGSSSTYMYTFDHHAVMPNLQPDTTYYYSCGDAQGGWSPVLSFQTAPATSRPFKVAVFGDMGLENSQDTFKMLRDLADDVSLMWHVGDISYADDDFLRGGILSIFLNHYEPSWNQYMNLMQSVAAKVPYMVLPGNHEDSCHSPVCFLSLSGLYHKLRNFTAYNRRFRMPYEESGGNSNMWYSFNYGNVHFVSINTETDLPGAAEGKFSIWGDGGFGNQLKWLEADLAAASAQRHLRPWILVAGHRPLYTLSMWNGKQSSGYARSLQQVLEGLFVKYGVDVYFAGHVHAYERAFPAFNDKRVSTSYNSPTHPVHIVSGAAGDVEALSHLRGTGRPDWSAAKDDTVYGLGVLEVDGGKLEWKFYNALTELPVDSVTIEKDVSQYAIPEPQPQPQIDDEVVMAQAEEVLRNFA